MKSIGTIRVLFAAAGVYDGALGLAFLFAGGAIFDALGVTPPNHPGYVQFPAALLVVFALMFFAVAADPVRNRNLVPYGILLKASYCGVTGYHWLVGGIPSMWKPFWFGDLLFLLLFAWAWAALRGEAARQG